MLTMLHAYALEGGTGVQYSCKSWLHEDCVIAIDTGQYWAAKNMSRILYSVYCETQKPHINSVGLISTQQDQLHTISSTLT